MLYIQFGKKRKKICGLTYVIKISSTKFSYTKKKENIQLYFLLQQQEYWRNILPRVQLQKYFMLCQIVKLKNIVTKHIAETEK